MPDINDLKESADRLAKQARETAELGVQVAREQLHSLIKDPEMLRRMEEAEDAFDSQMREVSRRIEEGAHQMFSMFNNLMAQPPFTAPEQEPTETPVTPKD